MRNFKLLSIVFVWMASVVFSADVMEIVSKANLASYYGGADGKAVVAMTITDRQQRERTREFIITRKDIEDGKDQKFFVYFQKPTDVRKMVFMVHKHVGMDDDRWLYVPALDLVQRIAASDKRTSFVGSDFLYEDVSGRQTTEDKHELLSEEDDRYVVKSVPLDAGSVEFSSYKVWIDKKNFLPMRAEYYKGDTLYRTVEAEKVEVIQGYPTITHSKVTNLETGSTTTLVFSNIKYDVGIEENLFTERFLRNPPAFVRK